MRHGNHAHDEALTGEHRLGDAGQAVLASLFLAVWITDSFFCRWSTFLNGTVPAVLRIPAGGLLLVLSYRLSMAGLAIVFGEKREKPEVIRTGVFRLVRHPVYLGELLLYLALLLFSISLAAAAIWLLAVLFLHCISRYEEKLLLRRFGEEYGIYMKEVPMWIPRLRLGPGGKRGG